MSKLIANRIASGLARPLFAPSPPGDADRFFVVEQHTGKIRILRLGTGTVDAVPFLQVSGLSTANEQGLLGLAFAPDYATSGTFYVSLMDATCASVIRRHKVLNLFKEFVTKADAGQPTLVLPLPTNPNTANDPETANGRITHPVALLWAKLFNARYRILLTKLALALSKSLGENSGGNGLAGRDNLVARSINREMKGPFGLRGIGNRLLILPLRADGTGTAAPPFEMPNSPLPTEPTAHRDFLLTLFAEAAAIIDDLVDPKSPANLPAALQTSLKQLKAADERFYRVGHGLTADGQVNNWGDWIEVDWFSWFNHNTVRRSPKAEESALQIGVPSKLRRTIWRAAKPLPIQDFRGCPPSSCAIWRDPLLHSSFTKTLRRTVLGLTREPAWPSRISTATVGPNSSSSRSTIRRAKTRASIASVGSSSNKAKSRTAAVPGATGLVHAFSNRQRWRALRGSLGSSLLTLRWLVWRQTRFLKGFPGRCSRQDRPSRHGFGPRKAVGLPIPSKHFRTVSLVTLRCVG